MTLDILDTILKCKQCKHLYDLPLILPCFNKICKSCVFNNSKNNTLQCPYCFSPHKFPENGFSIDQDLHELVEHRSNFNEMLLGSFGHSYQEFNRSFEHARHKFEQSLLEAVCSPKKIKLAGVRKDLLSIWEFDGKFDLLRQCAIDFEYDSVKFVGINRIVFKIKGGCVLTVFNCLSGKFDLKLTTEAPVNVILGISKSSMLATDLKSNLYVWDMTEESLVLKFKFKQEPSDVCVLKPGEIAIATKEV